MIRALLSEFVRSRIGQGLLVAAVLLALVWWAYSSVWQRGYDVAAAEGDARLRSMQAQIEAERRASERAARQAEKRQSAALQAVAEQFEQDKTDAQDEHDRVVADLRAGAVRLRRQWQGCETAAARVPAAGASAGELDAAAELRATGAGDLVRIGAACDATIRGLQAVARAYAQGGAL